MQEVKFSKNMLNSLEFDTLLTLEQAQWYTQNEGFIPLPRKSNKKNLYVIFTSQDAHLLIKFIKNKIIKYRISRIINRNDGYIEGFIIVLETEKSSSNHYYYFNTFKRKIIKR